MNTQAAISEFLAQERIAFVGVSRNPSDFSRAVYRAMRESGCTLVPVNAALAPEEPGQIEGQLPYRTVSEIPGEVSGALLMIPAEAALEAAQECAARGISRIWLHRGAGGRGAVSPEAVAFCEQNKMQVIAGECPLMFVGRPGWIHRLHALGKRMRGTYPA